MKKSRHGFTLLEMLVVMALIGLVGGLMAKLLVETLSMERHQRLGFDKMLQDNALADQFRSDVAQAETAPERWQNFEANKETLILQMPKGEHLVYRRQENSLHRLAFGENSKSERQVPTGDEDTVFEFLHDPQNPKLLHLRLTADRKEGPKLVLDIAAALGGDLR